MTITAWRKSAVAPRGSLSRPSSNTCRNRSQTLGSAFSNSSSSTTENGWRRIRRHERRVLGARRRRRRASATREPGFWYSLMSSRIIRSPEPNRNSASALAISVLPVPVGPTNSSTACGRVGSVSPALSSATRSTMHSTASGWPITRAPKNARSASTSSRSRSSSSVARQPRALGDRREHVGQRQRLVALAPAPRRLAAARAARPAAPRRRGSGGRARAPRAAPPVGARRGLRRERERARLVHRLDADDVERVAHRRPRAHEPLVGGRLDDPGDVHARAPRARASSRSSTPRCGFWRSCPRRAAPRTAGTIHSTRSPSSVLHDVAHAAFELADVASCPR